MIRFKKWFGQLTLYIPETAATQFIPSSTIEMVSTKELLKHKTDCQKVLVCSFLKIIILLLVFGRMDKFKANAWWFSPMEISRLGLFLKVGPKKWPVSNLPMAKYSIPSHITIEKPFAYFKIATIRLLLSYACIKTAEASFLIVWM